uniref:Uncharacterized protein n=1 Tax=Oryza meridionalis TaxID=40149 RepID=A0A0E0FCF5_9ORYZ
MAKSGLLPLTILLLTVVAAALHGADLVTAMSFEGMEAAGEGLAEPFKKFVGGATGAFVESVGKKKPEIKDFADGVKAGRKFHKGLKSGAAAWAMLAPPPPPYYVFPSCGYRRCLPAPAQAQAGSWPAGTGMTAVGRPGN